MVGQPNRIFGGGQEVLDAMGFPGVLWASPVAFCGSLVLSGAVCTGYLKLFVALCDSLWLSRALNGSL